LEKIRVYVYSFKVSTLDFVDKEGAMHACAEAGSSAFSGLKNYPGFMDNRYLSDEERKAIIIVEDFCNKHSLEFETIDVATMGTLTKIKLKAKGLMNFPAIVFKEKVFHGVPTEETLKELLE
jgi:glutaredoxin